MQVIRVSLLSEVFSNKDQSFSFTILILSTTYSFEPRKLMYEIVSPFFRVLSLAQNFFVLWAARLTFPSKYAELSIWPTPFSKVESEVPSYIKPSKFIASILITPITVSPSISRAKLEFSFVLASSSLSCSLSSE